MAVGFLLSFVFVLCCLEQFSEAVNTITKGQSIADGGSLISTDEIFELGFFSPASSNLRYLGIWYHNIDDKAVVWVANRENPISDGNGTLAIGDDGKLMVLDGNKKTVWSSKASALSNDTAAVLGDDGNLVLSSKENIGILEKCYWQSFEDPTDTYLPGMRVRVNAAMGENHAFSSWKSAIDPSPGNYTLGVDPRGSPQIVIWENLKRRWRSGQWNSLIFTGVPSMINLSSFLYGFKLSAIESDGSMYFTYIASNKADLLRFKISWDGKEEQLRWNDSTKNWTVIQKQPENDCELYNFCGNFGLCNNLNSLKCSCMEGFVPKHAEQWSMGNWSGGCVRRTHLQCQRNSSEAGENGEDGFKGFKGMKLPDFADVVPVGQDNCEQKCLQNCSCNAYADISGIGCMIWRGDLVDVQHFESGGNLLHIRLAHSELDIGSKRKLSNAVIVIIVVIGALFLGISVWLFWRFRRKMPALCKDSSFSCCKSKDTEVIDMSKSKEFSTDLSGPADILIDGSEVNGSDLPMFNFSSIALATSNFSEENKLGQGGFGPVYKGKLPGGQEIAVKRLSRKSGQGVEEFKNEIILIAKLQHRNLVRLLGCCIQGEEKMLIYEYMPNKSLDFFLFDPTKQALLDWTKRFSIIEGIARGLLYLHRDSRLRIIHRDLKASNILLDEDMNPKISDFGMARIFGFNQNEANTNRVVGTYGYMSPEYAMEGLFSVKSDVYSFGVLLLEIISGRKNTSFRLSEHSSLIGHAWNLWNEGKATELIDPNIWDSSSEKQVLRCIQVGMLCVQDLATYRPTMASVVLMLESETPNLPLPRQPTFTSMRSSVDGDFLMEAHDTIECTEETKGASI
ncbi:S-receptor-like serine/threonine-protein kinase [Melia azedarach]|uniref:S-receptor-like serine/threonine-protein kinase n=1 Tax=Melia azedarach TaxID=155640 RepID=A0ACC1WWN2_MELAZ|nr:S-receptor-like serine/threonine-protein kinase [Melia azedarach]